MKALRKELSYKIDFANAKFIPNPANHVKYVIDLKGNFETGLLHRVLSFCQRNKVQFKAEDRRSTQPAFKVPGRAFKSTFKVKPYDDQLKAINAILSHQRGVISMPTGSGKSMVISLLVESLKMRTLIVVPTLELKLQLTTTLKSALTTMEGITVENVDSSALNKPGKYDCLVIDECHHSAAKTYRNLNKKAWKDIRWRYSFSATPFRNNPEEQLLYESVTGNVIYELSYASAVEKGYIMPVESFHYEMPKVKTDAVTYAQVYSELVVNNEYRNKLIALTMVRLNEQDKFTLCLVKEIKHGNLLSELTGIPFVNGQDEESRQYIQEFNSGRIKSLIGTTGVLSEGIDTKPAEYIIIAGLGKAKSQFMQACGRGVRKHGDKESAKIILIKDRSHKFLIRHFNAQCAILRQEYLTLSIKLEIE